MTYLTDLEAAVAAKLRGANEGESDGWLTVYLPNCAFSKQERGALGSLEKKGLYRETASCFGEVRAAHDAEEPRKNGGMIQ